MNLLKVEEEIKKQYFVSADRNRLFQERNRYKDQAHALSYQLWQQKHQNVCLMYIIVFLLIILGIGSFYVFFSSY